MTLQEQNFYSLIGQISIGFSNLESQIKGIIGLLVKFDDEFVHQIILEDNNISQNLKLLMKLTKYRSVEEDRIKALHSAIDKIRINRNLFIHGLWKLHGDEDGLVFVCETRKVEFKKVTLGVATYLNKFQEFKSEDFEKELIQITDCSQIAEEVITTLENERF
jgi:hypothetical protein